MNKPPRISREALKKRYRDVAMSRGLTEVEIIFLERFEACMRVVLPDGHGCEKRPTARRNPYVVIRWGRCTSFLHQGLANMLYFTDWRTKGNRGKNHALDINGSLIYFWMESDCPGDETEQWLSGTNWRKYLW